MYRTSIVFIATCLVLSVTASVAAQSPEPPPYPEGAGVTFEPAGPSVWRAVEPEWDCDAAYPRRPFHDGAEVAPDGSIWFLDHQRGIRELGSCPIVEPKLAFGTRDQALGPDGTLWVLNDDRLWSWDGADWLVHLEGFNQPGRVGDIDGGGYSYSTECEAGPCYFFVDVAPDGRVWLSGTTVSAYDGAEWTNYMDDPLVKIVVGFGPEGSAWVQGGEGGGDIFVIQPSGEPPASGPAGEAAASPPATTAESAIAESFPASIGGRPVEVKTWNGLEWLARYDLEAPGAGAVTGSEATEALVAAAGTTLEELTIATAVVEPSPGNVATIAAVHIPGSQAYDLIDPVIDVLVGATEPLVSWRLMAHRWVALVTDNATPGSYPVKVYPAGDTVWVIQADRPVAENIVAELPSQPTLVEPDLVISTAAPSSSASQEAVSQSVEIAGAGISMTFPAGWRIWSMQPSQGETFVEASNGSLRQTCRVFMMEEFATPEAAADRFGTPHPGIEILDREAIELPVGDALRVSWGYDEARHGFHDYYVATPDGVVSVSCVGEEPPADRWLHIVESIETLPASAPASASFDSRVQMPDHGFAVDFPAEWLVSTWPFWPGSPFGGDFVLRAQTVPQDGGPASAECWIEDDVELPGQPDVESIEGLLETIAHQVGERRLRALPILTQAELPSGRSGRVEWHWKRNGELPTTAWVLSDGDRRLLFMCRSEQPPGDRWLSIAETFEFLPVE